MPLMLQVGFGYQAFIAGCMMAQQRWFHYCKIDGYPSLTSSGLSPYISGDHGDYWANDRSVLFAITGNGDMDADLAVVYIRDGYVDAVYGDHHLHLPI